MMVSKGCCIWLRLGNDLHFDDAADSTNVEHLAAELVSKVGDGLEMLVLVTEGFRGGELAGMEIASGTLLERLLVLVVELGVGGRRLGVAGGDLAVVGEQLLKVLGAEDVDLGEEQLALDEGGAGVVEDGPDGDLEV